MVTQEKQKHRAVQVCLKVQRGECAAWPLCLHSPVRLTFHTFLIVNGWPAWVHCVRRQTLGVTTRAQTCDEGAKHTQRLDEGGRPRNHGGKAMGRKVSEHVRAMVAEWQMTRHSSEMQKQENDINIKMRTKD